MKSNCALLTVAACLLPMALQASQIINIDALCSNGTSVNLNPGTYEVSVIGTSQGGRYSGWNYATANFGTSAATPAPNSWVDSFSITANGVQTSYLPSGNPVSDNAAAALALYQSSILYADNYTPASSIADAVFFTLASSQSVNFKVPDYFFVDNWGGTSLKLTSVAPASATPEPSTFGLMAIALTGSIAAFRRKLKR